MIQKPRDTAEYLVGSCANCGMMNIVPRHKGDGCTCADCGSGPLIPLGYGILQGDRVTTLHVGVDVDTSQLDKVGELVEKIADHVDRITDRVAGLKEEVSRLDGADIHGSTRSETI